MQAMLIKKIKRRKMAMENKNHRTAGEEIQPVSETTDQIPETDAPESDIGGDGYRKQTRLSYA